MGQDVYKRQIFHFVAQNADICRVLLCGPQETAFVSKVNQLVRERVLDEWADLMGKESRLGYGYVFSFFVAGCIGLLKQWLEPVSYTHLDVYKRQRRPRGENSERRLY